MVDNLNDLFDSVNKAPAYWMQVAILEFLQSLQAVRTAKGVLSNKDLARRIGVSPPTLSRWLNGNENLTISTMCRLAAALDAAVHIHVADNSERGRWQAEEPAVFPGAITESAAISAQSPQNEGKLLTFKTPGQTYRKLKGVRAASM